MTLIVPEYLQTKKYNAKRDRLTLAHGGAIVAGVWDTSDYKVIQRAAGANMSVDVGAGFALVPANNTGNKGLYHIENDAAVNVSLAASNATNPRIDMVYVQVDDSADGAAADDTPQFGVVTGTPTAGATLDNRTGAGTLPSNSLLLADVLVGAAVTSVTATNIRDRRAWARGATALYTTSTSPTTNTDPWPLSPTSTFRVEVATGQLLLLDLIADLATASSAGNTLLEARVFMDGTTQIAAAAWQQTSTGATGNNRATVADSYTGIALAPGSHVFKLTAAFVAGSGTFSVARLRVRVVNDFASGLNT